MDTGIAGPVYADVSVAFIARSQRRNVNTYNLHNNTNYTEVCHKLNQKPLLPSKKSSEDCCFTILSTRIQYNYYNNFLMIVIT